MAAKEKKWYVSNKAFYECYVQWYKDIEQALQAGKPEPEIPPFIVDCIMKICTKLAYRPNFYNYSYREDMVADAIMSCIVVAKKFKIEKSDNPFSYFTQIAWNVFLRYIKMEKKETYVKAKLIMELPIHDLLDIEEDDESGVESSLHNGFMEYIREHAYIADTEKPVRTRKKAKLDDDSNLEEFIQEDLEDNHDD